MWFSVVVSRCDGVSGGVEGGANGSVDAFRVEHVTQHDFTCLQFVVAQSHLDQLEQSDLLFIFRILTSEKMVSVYVLQLIDEIVSIP